MKLARTLPVLCAVSMLSGCSLFQQTDVYEAGAEPYYISINEDDLRTRECRIDIGDEVSVAGQGAWFSGNEIQITEGGVFIISGSCSDSCINITTVDPVKLMFNSADISNSDGCAIISSADKLIICSDSGSTVLTGSGGDYNTAVYSTGSVLFTGSGGLSLDGGVFSAGGIRFSPAVSTMCEILNTDSGELITGTLYINK